MIARLSLLVIGLSLILIACGDSTGEPPPTVTVVAEGLVNPLGLAALEDGRLLVAEEGTGNDDTSAGVSIVALDGTVTRLVSGLPSSRDSGSLSGAPLVGVDPTGTLGYTAHFESGALFTFDIPPPKATLGAPLDAADLTRTMTPLNNVRLTNPFDITFREDGRPVVTDASENGLAIETGDLRTRFFHRFGAIPVTDTLSVEAVPTGITRIGDEYWVTLTGGCPFPQGSGRLVAVDDDRNERVVLDGLNMPVDVALDAGGTVWLLEFTRFPEGASCFSEEGYQPGTGRLSRLNGDGNLEVVLDDLDLPGAVQPMPDGSLFITEIFSGRLLRVTFGEPEAQPVTEDPDDGEERRFIDATAEVGLDFNHGAFATGVFSDPVAGMGAGLCWLDFNGDGWLDLYLINSHSLIEVEHWKNDGGLPRNALFANRGGRFEQVEGSGAELALRGNGCVAADFDLDGDPDIYVTAEGPNALLRNDGGAFTEIAAAAGVAAGEWNTAAVVGDVDGNGWPDLFVGTYIDLDVKVDNPIGAFPQDHPGIANHLYLNQGEMAFVEAGRAAGLDAEDRTLGALLADIDLDGDLDLYTANDGTANRLSMNDGTGQFSDVTETAGGGDSGSGMGIAGGDYDGDGALDVLVTNWQTELHALYRSDMADGLSLQYRTFDIGVAGLGNGSTGWGTTWADYDNDTDVDLLIANGRVPLTGQESDRQLVRLYRNLLADGEPDRFLDWTKQAGLTDVGPLIARGSAAADFDNDGDLDLAINQIAGPALLLRNDGDGGNWLEVAFADFRPGTVVTADLPDGTRLVRHLLAGSSYLASEDPRLHFGLGSAASATLTVRWPNGDSTTLEAEANSVVEAVAPQ